MCANLLIKIAKRLDYSSNYNLADKLDKIAQDMSIPYTSYPQQQTKTYKNRLPIEKDLSGDDQLAIDRKFAKDAKIYVTQLIRDPLVKDNTVAKLMLDKIINDPVYKIEKSSFVGLINGYRRIYSQITENSKDVHKLAELKPDAEKILLRILGKM